MFQFLGVVLFVDMKKNERRTGSSGTIKNYLLATLNLMYLLVIQVEVSSRKLIIQV